jgi:hypothetical protein
MCSRDDKTRGNALQSGQQPEPLHHGGTLNNGTLQIKKKTMSKAPDNKHKRVHEWMC